MRRDFQYQSTKCDATAGLALCARHDDCSGPGLEVYYSDGIGSDPFLPAIESLSGDPADMPILQAFTGPDVDDGEIEQDISNVFVSPLILS